MKRIITYVVLIIILITLGVFGYSNKPEERPKDEILNVKYYKYDSKTNTYDEFMIDKHKITYTGTEYDLDGCKTYKYNPNTSIIKLDCNRAFRIGGESKDGLIIDMEDKRSFFYANKESSFNYEFQKYFQTTESMYKSTGENALRIKEIDINRLKELLNEPTVNFIYIKNNTCETSCTIFNHAFNKFSEKDNTYYLNLDKITQKDFEHLHEDFETFPDSLKELSQTYPQVLVIKDKKLQEIIEIELDGFDATKYENYAQKYGEENNENNE